MSSIRQDAASWDYDVGVIGGGPGGSTAAALLAARGRRVLVLERDRFPRFHIGESLLPDSNAILDELGIDDAILEREFVPKRGATFTTADGAVHRFIDFNRAWQTPQPRTFQVTRARFDELLLQRARDRGAEVRENCKALDLRFDAGGVGLSYAEGGGAPCSVRVGAVVDASGRAGFVANRLGVRIPDPDLRKVSVHAHYEGIPRLQGRRSGDIRIVSRPDLAWVWFIPLSPTLTSVGVVLDHETYAAMPRDEPDRLLARCLRDDPASADLMAGARRVSPARVDADFSYSARAYAGDRWLLVGDAGAFLDPVFSTGVTLAMRSGKEAAEALEAGLQAGDLSASRFRPYGRRLGRRYAHFRRFVVGFYDPAFRDLFFQPSERYGLAQAVTSVLAGNWRPSLRTRACLGLFFALVAGQRRFAIAPRTHSCPPLRAGGPTAVTPAVSRGSK